MIQNKTNTILVWLLLSIMITFSLNAASIKIMPLGDSITEGGGNIPDNPENNTSTYGGLIQPDDQIGYRGKLYDYFVGAGYIMGTSDGELDFVGSKNTGTNYTTSFDMDHEGHSGYTSFQIAENIDSWLSDQKPDIVLLHVGTNDGAQSIPIGDANATDQDANTTVNNVRKILTSIFAHNANSKVFLARIIEARRNDAHTPNWTQNVNDAVEAMVAEHNDTANIVIVNMQDGADITYDPCGTTQGDMQPFQDINGIYYYDFHPNYKGYEKMAQKWFDALIASDWLPSVAADTTPPSITLAGGSVTLYVGDTYIEPGYDATDTSDGDINNSVVIGGDTVDTNNIGTYTITYDVNDTAGNPAEQKTRTVTVIDDITDSNSDSDGNGIPDAQEKEWFNYDHITKTATIASSSEVNSTLMVEELNVIPSVEESKIILKYEDKNAYVSANENAEVETGFSSDATLKVGTFFKAGTASVLKEVNEKVIIETKTKLNKGEKIVIG